MVCLENVARKVTAEIVTEQLRSAGYWAVAYFINSSSFGIPQSRCRLYVLGIDPRQCDILDPPDQWVKWLEACILSAFKFSISNHSNVMYDLQSCVLPDAESGLARFLNSYDLAFQILPQDISAECTVHKPGFGSLMLEEADSYIQDALSKLRKRQATEDEVKESLKTGRTWPKCWEKHEAARKQLSERLGVKA